MALRAIRPLWIALLLALACLAEGAVAPVTNCLAVLRMPPGEAEQAIPVRLTGTLTMYEAGSQLCFVQDEISGVYVYPARWISEFQAGDVVEIEGETGAGRFSSIVNQAVLRKTGKRATVLPKRVSIEDLNTGRYDCQYVELEGIVHSAEPAQNTLRIELWNGGSSAAALVWQPPDSGTNLTDARVSLRGIAGTFYQAGNLAGFGLFVRSPAELRVLTPPPDPFAGPARPVATPYFFSPDGLIEHRIEIAGAVAVHWPGQALFVQDETGVMPVFSSAPGALAAGDKVEASGFLRRGSDQPQLADALFQRTGRQALSVSAMTAEALAGTNRAVLAALEGAVLRVERRTNGVCLWLEAGQRLIPAFCPAPLSDPGAGSQVRVTGVWSAAPAGWASQAGKGLWLQSTGSVTLLSRPKKNAPPVQGFVSTVLPPVALAAGLVLAGAVALRKSRQARAAAQRSQSARELLGQAQDEVQRLNAARERLGRDLHDHIIQSIYAVGLNLDDCAQQVRARPEQVEPRLKTALAEINGVIRELRNVILGLETNAIEPREFRTALKSLGLALGQDGTNRMRLDIEQSAMESLTPLQATELIHIAREALSNSLRHGHAETTTIALQPAGDRIRFAIEDDGAGFDPGAAGGNGFGLRNMAKRAGNLGAIFTIFAEPGAGTRIVLDIPRQKQHFSPGEPSARAHR